MDYPAVLRDPPLSFQKWVKGGFGTPYLDICGSDLKFRAVLSCHFLGLERVKGGQAGQGSLFLHIVKLFRNSWKKE